MDSQPRTTLTVKETAKLLGIGHSSAYNALRNNDFPVPTIKIGGRYVVPVQPLLALLGLDELPNEPKGAD